MANRQEERCPENERIHRRGSEPAEDGSGETDRAGRRDVRRQNAGPGIDGKPLAAGKIAFHQDNGQFVGCKFKDGKFKIDRVPTGVRLRVIFEGKGVPLAFASEDTTALVVQVSEKGPNNFEFTL